MDKTVCETIHTVRGIGLHTLRDGTDMGPIAVIPGSASKTGTDEGTATVGVDVDRQRSNSGIGGNGTAGPVIHDNLPAAWAGPEGRIHAGQVVCDALRTAPVIGRAGVTTGIARSQGARGRRIPDDIGLRRSRQCLAFQARLVPHVYGIVAQENCGYNDKGYR